MTTTILTTQTEDLRRSHLSINTVVLQNGIEKKILYVYNESGLYFKVFDSIVALSQFLSGESEKCLCELYSKEELDALLKAPFLVTS